MDIEQLINSTDVSNPEQVMVLQKALKAQGLYAGAIDGQYGGGTLAAVNTFRENKSKAEQMRMQQLQLETQQQQAEAQRIQAEAEKAKQDPINQLTQLGTQVAPIAGGAAFGLGAGHLYNRAAKAGDINRTKQIGQIASMNNLHPEAAKDALRDIDKSSVRAKRLGAGYIPLGMLAASTATRLAGTQFPEDSDMREWLNLLGTGGQTAATTFALRNAGNLAGGPNPDAAVDRASINSNYRDYLEKQSSPQGSSSAPARAYASNNISDLDRDTAVLVKNNRQVQLYDKAKQLGLSPRKNDNKTKLAKMLLESGKKLPKKMFDSTLKSLPWVAGGLAASSAAYDQANAAGFDELESAATALGVGAGVGAGTYGAMKGTEKVGAAIMNSPGKAAQIAGRVGSKALPILGWGAAAYDLYDTANSAINEGNYNQTQGLLNNMVVTPDQYDQMLANVPMDIQKLEELKRIRSMTHGADQMGQY